MSTTKQNSQLELSHTKFNSARVNIPPHMGMPTKTLNQLVEEIKALSPEERRERAKGATKARLKLERRIQKGNLRTVSSN
jgi:hypothetical protein